MSLAWDLLVFAFVGFAVSWGVLHFISVHPFWRRVSRRAVQPHHAARTVIPRFGGVALATAFVVVVVLAWLGLRLSRESRTGEFGMVIGALGMFGVGLLDDFHPIGARRKLLLQVLVALVASFLGVSIDALKHPWTNVVYPLGGWAPLVTVLWLVALTNLINLIDGIDGLAGGVCLMLMCLFVCMGIGPQGLSFLTAVGMAGALLAFLIHNFPPALVYLGDGGAYFLGFLIGAMAIISSNKGSAVAALVAPLLALGLPIADTCVTLLRRVLVGVPLFRADRHHLHHRLMRMGFTRRRAVLVLYGLSALCLLGAFMAFASEGRWVPVLVGALFVLLTLSLWRLGLAQTWQGMRQVMDDSLRMRKDSQYALSMVRWLELEAERCESIDELWTNFEFVARKLGFCHVKLSLEDGQRLWQSNHVPFEDKRLRRSQHEIAEPCPMSLEFTAERRGMSLRVFEQLAELAAEGWIRSARRWREITGAPVRFSSDTAFVRRATGWRGVRKQLTRLAVGGGS